MILLFLIIPALGLWIAIDNGAFETAIAFLVSVVGWLVNLLLSPVNALINSTIPEFNNGLQTINAFFGIAGQYLAWVVDATFIPQLALTMIISYYIFSFGVTLFSWGMKLAFNWYQAIIK